jgi:predicted metal-dependent hydrolase
MILYKIIYSKRRSIGISIGPDSGVIVRAPWRTSSKTIENLIQSKSAWIKKHLENHSSFIRISRNKEYIDGESHYYCGRQFSLRIVQSKTSYVKHYESVIEIGVKVKEEKEKVKLLLEIWYKKMAEELFRKKLDELLSRYNHYNFSPIDFAVRAMKGRWGSCSSKGKITLSIELVKLDDKYSEYVLLHELCHLKHHNHSAVFYQLLSEVCPEWKNLRKELRRYVR